jgi:predicted dehydrogenase
MSVNIAIIGTGYWGPNITRNFYQNPNCKLLYCCDIDKKQLEKVRHQFPAIPLTTCIDQVLNDGSVQALAIVTPSNTHYSLTKRALLANKHVFVEKPFTLSVKEAKELIKLNKRTKKVIMVGHTYEYHPAVLEIKKYLKEGLLGDLYYIYCSRLNLGKVREETNALWNLAPHDFSILRFLLEQMPIKISAFGQPYLQKKYEDVVFLNLRYKRNIVAHVHVSWLDPSKERKITLVGSKKMVIFDDMDNEAPIKIYDKGFVKLVNEKGERMFKEFSLKLRPGDIHLPYIESREPLKEECNHFIDSILNEKSPLSDEVSGYEVVKMLTAAQQSLTKGGTWITLTG